jgi:hypothetical protein
VYETLLYTALLRLPRDMSVEAKRERVNTVVRALGLNTCKDTIIGAPRGMGKAADKTSGASVLGFCLQPWAWETGVWGTVKKGGAPPCSANQERHAL